MGKDDEPSSKHSAEAIYKKKASHGLAELNLVEINSEKHTLARVSLELNSP